MFELLLNFLIFCYINFVDLTILHILIVSLSLTLYLSHTHTHILMILSYILYLILNQNFIKSYYIISYYIIYNKSWD